MAGICDDPAGVAGQIFELVGGRIHVCLGWNDDPEFDHGKRWDAAEPGKKTLSLIAGRPAPWEAAERAVAAPAHVPAMCLPWSGIWIASVACRVVKIVKNLSESRRRNRNAFPCGQQPHPSLHIPAAMTPRAQASPQSWPIIHDFRIMETHGFKGHSKAKPQRQTTSSWNAAGIL